MFIQVIYYFFLLCTQFICSDSERKASENAELNRKDISHKLISDRRIDSLHADMVSKRENTILVFDNYSRIQETKFIFQSGFEPNTRIIDQNNDDARIRGTDYTLSGRNNWEYDLENHEKVGYCNIQYQGGNGDQRLAEIATDPLNPSNRTLRFWIKEPNLNQQAGRVQANIYKNKNIKTLDYSVRLLIPDDFESVKRAPFRVKWLTLMEFWNNANWSGEPYQFRITVNLQKWSKDADSLRIGIKSQVRDLNLSQWADPPVWEYINENFEVPIGKWMRIDIHFKEGDTNTGRFVLKITPEGENSTLVHDIRNATHHPNDPNPDGLSHFNPLKLYTSDRLIKTVRQDGKLLQVYWDDFQLAIENNK